MDFINRAIDLSIEAAQHGDGPFGALLVNPQGTDRQSAFIAEARNTQHSSGIPFMHAEMNLLKTPRDLLPNGPFNGLAMVVNSESCGGCANFYIKSGVRLVIYGAPTEAHRLNPAETVLVFLKRL